VLIVEPPNWFELVLNSSKPAETS